VVPTTWGEEEPEKKAQERKPWEKAKGEIERTKHQGRGISKGTSAKLLTVPKKKKRIQEKKKNRIKREKSSPNEKARQGLTQIANIQRMPREIEISTERNKKKGGDDGKKKKKKKYIHERKEGGAPGRGWTIEV